MKGRDQNAPRRYCVACETTFVTGVCPCCDGPGVPGRNGNEPGGWPVMSAAALAVLPSAP